MPNGNGHYHAFRPMPSEAKLSRENQGCAVCLGFRDERVHEPPKAPSATSGHERPESQGAVGLLVKCPSCGAQLGQQCFNSETHRRLARPHPARVSLQREQVSSPTKRNQQCRLTGGRSASRSWTRT
jgi:hypothetical protein